MKKIDIWEFQSRLTSRLLWWGGLSAALGLFLLLFPGFLRGVGIQFVAWGLIDAAIAWFGRRASEKRLAGLPADDSARAQVAAQQAQSIWRILWLNTVLDVLYVAGGIGLWIAMGADPVWRGHAVGVIVQGGFLFFFDLLHALNIKTLSG